MQHRRRLARSTREARIAPAEVPAVVQGADPHLLTEPGTESDRRPEAGLGGYPLDRLVGSLQQMLGPDHPGAQEPLRGSGSGLLPEAAAERPLAERRLAGHVGDGIILGWRSPLARWRKIATIVPGVGTLIATRWPGRRSSW